MGDTKIETYPKLSLQLEAVSEAIVGVRHQELTQTLRFKWLSRSAAIDPQGFALLASNRWTFDEKRCLVMLVCAEGLVMRRYSRLACAED
jgi:hypothetical protein